MYIYANISKVTVTNIFGFIHRNDNSSCSQTYTQMYVDDVIIEDAIDEKGKKKLKMDGKVKLRILSNQIRSLARAISHPRARAHKRKKLIFQMHSK